MISLQDLLAKASPPAGTPRRARAQKPRFTTSVETAIAPDGRNYLLVPLPGDVHGFTKGEHAGKHLRVDKLEGGKVHYTGIDPSTGAAFASHAAWRPEWADGVSNGMQVIHLATGPWTPRHELDDAIEHALIQDAFSFYQDGPIMLAAALRALKAGRTMEEAREAAIAALKHDFELDSQGKPVALDKAGVRRMAERIWEGNVEPKIRKVRKEARARANLEPPKVQIGDVTDRVSVTMDNLVRYTWIWGISINGGRPYLERAFDTVEEREAYPTPRERAAALKVAKKLRDQAYDTPRSKRTR